MDSPCFGSIKFCRLVIAELGTDGVPNPGADNINITDKAMRLKWTPVYTEGEEITVPNGCGDLAINHTDPPRLKHWDIELEIAYPDPEIMALIVGGDVITSGADTIGYASPELGVVNNPNGVSLDAYSVVKVGDEDPDTRPWLRFVFAKTKNWRFAGDRELNTGALVNVFSAIAVENSNYFDGPLASFPWSHVDGRAWAFARTNLIPDAICGSTTLVAS